MFLLFEIREDEKSCMFFLKSQRCSFISIKQGAISSADFKRIRSVHFLFFLRVMLYIVIRIRNRKILFHFWLAEKLQKRWCILQPQLTWQLISWRTNSLPHTHTHTHIYIYIYICVCVCVCVCVCTRVVVKPSSWARCDTRSILGGVLQVWIRSFPLFDSLP